MEVRIMYFIGIEGFWELVLGISDGGEYYVLD